MQIHFLPPSSSGPAGLLRKVLAIALTLVLAVVVLMFSAVLLSVLLVIGIIGGAFLWWKLRHVRKLMQEMQRAQAAAKQGEAFGGEVFEGEVVEGEVIRVEASRPEDKR